MSENAAAEPLSKPEPSPQRSLLQEAADIWKSLPHKGLFAVIFIAWVGLFHFTGNATFGYSKSPSLFQWLREDYLGVEDDAHGQYMPIIVLIFLWIKRKELLDNIGKIWWPALIYLGAAILLHVMAYRVQQTRISTLAFILGFHALFPLIWGREWLRRTIFPVFLLLFSIPFGSIANIITVDLRILVTRISVAIGSFLGANVVSSGSRIIDGERGIPLYEVAPACSGMRSLIALTALAVIYSFLNFDRIWKRIILIMSAVPLAIFANVVRITTVIIIGETISQSLAVKIEQNFGFFTFAIAIAGMMVIGWLLREKTPAPPPSTTPDARPLEAQPT